MKTAVIIVNYNDGENLIQAARRMSSYAIADDVIVVDNNSSDGTSEAVRKVPKTHIVYAGKNGGYGFGNNLGMQYAIKELNADHALIMNPDAEVPEEAIKAMLCAMTADDSAAVCAPVCTTPESTFAAPAAAWPIRVWHLELFEHCPILRRIFAKKTNYPKEFLDGIGSCEVGAVPGSCLMVDLKKIDSIEGYDENVFLYCEENILGYKLKKASYKTLLLKDVKYLHNHKPALPSPESMKRLTDSELYYFKNYLQVSGFKMLISKILFAVAGLEVRIYSLCRRKK